MSYQIKARPGEANAAICLACVLFFLGSRFLPNHPYMEGLELLKGNAVSIYDGGYWLLISSILFHGDMMHLLFNMFALWHFGNIVEESIGSVRYVLLIIATAFAAAGFQLVFSMSPGIGISGVVCALIGYMWQARGDYESFYMWMTDSRFRGIMIMLIALIPIDYFILNRGGFGIAHYAHFAGVAAGALFGMAFSIKTDPQQKMIGAMGLAMMIVTIVVALLIPISWSPSRKLYLEYKTYQRDMNRAKKQFRDDTGVSDNLQDN